MVNATEIEMTDDEYEAMLTEGYGTVDICGFTFDSGRVYRELDPTGFRVGKADQPVDRWECEECNEEYDNEDDAEDCCPPKVIKCASCGNDIEEGDNVSYSSDGMEEGKLFCSDQCFMDENMESQSVDKEIIEDYGVEE